MNRIEKAFNQSKVFAAYITAGDGTVEYQLSMIRALLAGGVNLLEVGVPFSDPIADGLVIQRAMHRALQAHTTVSDVLKLIALIRQESPVPIVLFTYYNPILAQKDDFYARAKTAGVDGILVVDLPFFERSDYLVQCNKHAILPIAVIAPTTEPKRLIDLAHQGKGFLYYACRKGTTGVRAGLPDDIDVKIAAIKAVSSLPILVGFGIADRASAQAALKVADGFVVGSHFIKLMEEGVEQEALQRLASSFTI